MFVEQERQLDLIQKNENGRPRQLGISGPASVPAGGHVGPREDVDYLQEGIASLKSARDEFAHTEETLRGLARGWLVLRVIRRRVAE